MFQASYTSESLAGQIENPRDRVEPTRVGIEAAGGSLLFAAWSFGEYDFVAIYEAPEIGRAHFPRPHPDIQLASMLALVDFRAENGATRVVPGSHRWDRERRPEPHEIVDADVAAGGAVLYLGSTIHFAGTNATTDEWRRGVHVSYTLGWLRTEENNSLAVPPSVARTLSPAAQALLGYAIHDAIADGGGYLGMVRMRDPLELLEEHALAD
jgi:ectoine hydroxylase-related dioxygenase (phytanoyl-CoA dioxygenase family)